MPLATFVDVDLAADVDGIYDLVLDAPDSDAETSNSLATAIFMSLFTDRRASADEVADPMKRRGWIGDLVSDIPDDRFGSGFWLYEQSRLTPDITAGIAAEARSALQWMVDDGLVSSVVASVSADLAKRILYLNVTLGLTQGGVSQHAFPLASATRAAAVAA